MEITLTMEVKDEYLLIRSTGRLGTKDDLVTHARMIHDELSRYKHKKILTDNISTDFPPRILSYYEAIQHYLKDFQA